MIFIVYLIKFKILLIIIFVNYIQILLWKIRVYLKIQKAIWKLNISHLYVGVYVYTCSCVRMYVQVLIVYVEVRVHHEGSFLIHSTLLFRTRSLTEPGTPLSRPASQRVLGVDCAVSGSHTTGLQTYTCDLFRLQIFSPVMTHRLVSAEYVSSNNIFLDKWPQLLQWGYQILGLMTRSWMEKSMWLKSWCMFVLSNLTTMLAEVNIV